MINDKMLWKIFEISGNIEVYILYSEMSHDENKIKANEIIKKIY